MVPAPADQTAPTAPTGLGYSSVTATSVQLSWSASTDSGGSGLAGYKVFRALAPNGAVPVGTVGPAVLSFTDQPLRPSTTGYNYTVVAFDNAQNHSAASNSVVVTTPAATDTAAPAVPANLLGYLLTRNSVRVKWNASVDTGGSGIAGYRVYRNSTLISGANPTTGTSFDDVNLSYMTAYSYTIKAVDNTNNESAASAPADVTTDRELIFQDNFNRADTDYVLGPSWTSIYLKPRIVGNRAVGEPYGTAWTYYPHYQVYVSDQTSFKASADVLEGPASAYASAGIAFYQRYVNSQYVAYRAYIGFVYPGCVVSLAYDENLQDSGHGTVLASATSVPCAGTVSVETNAATGSVKVYVDGVLKINATIDTATMSGKVGIMTTSYTGAPGVTYNASVDNFILERN